MYLDRRFGLNLSLSEITLLFDLSLYLDRTLAQRKAQQKAKSKVKVAQSLRQRSHNFQLAERTSALRDRNFIMRMLYCDALY